MATARAKVLLRHLAESDRVGFTASEARQWLYPSRADAGAATATYTLLHQLVRDGLLHRLASGIYASALAGSSLDEWDIAMLLDPKGVLSHQSALMIHGLTQQLYRRITLSVPGSSHERRPGRLIQKVRYDFVVVAPHRFFGHEVRYMSLRPLRVTDLERTLLDTLGASSRVGGFEVFHHALEAALPRLNVPRLAEYLSRLRAPGLAQRMGYVLEQRGSGTMAHRHLKPLVGRRVVSLDTRAVAHGPLDAIWKVRLNTSLPE